MYWHAILYILLIAKGQNSIRMIRWNIAHRHLRDRDREEKKHLENQIDFFPFRFYFNELVIYGELSLITIIIIIDSTDGMHISL